MDEIDLRVEKGGRVHPEGAEHVLLHEGFKAAVRHLYGTFTMYYTYTVVSV